MSAQKIKDVNELLSNLTELERNNIENMICSIESDKQQAIIECINNCSSPDEQKDKNGNVLTKEQAIFNAFNLFPLKETKVLIIGQDPYPSRGKNAGRAHGLSFSFGNNKIPAEDSLLNIFKAIAKYRENEDIKNNDINKWNTNLENWSSSKKVLLLNSALTYCNKTTKEDRIKIWNPFIEKIIENLLKTDGKLVVFLWGDNAKLLFHNTIFFDKEKKDITEEITKDLLVLTTSHPSENYNAYKKGFCYEAPNHFKACDEFLFEKEEKDKDKYIWLNFPKNNEPDNT